MVTSVKLKLLSIISVNEEMQPKSANSGTLTHLFLYLDFLVVFTGSGHSSSGQTHEAVWIAAAGIGAGSRIDKAVELVKICL